MDEDEDFDPDELLELLEDGGDYPDFRATIVGRRLTLINWTPFLATGGPLGVLLRARGEAGVTIADLTLAGDGAGSREVIVEIVAPGPDPGPAEAVLVRWARAVGYTRIWLPGGVVDLDPAGRRLGWASVRCPNCRMRWSDGTPDFWAEVQQTGSFPRWCMLCGGDLPQWTRRPGDGRRGQPCRDVVS